MYYIISIDDRRRRELRRFANTPLIARLRRSPAFCRARTSSTRFPSTRLAIARHIARQSLRNHRTNTRHMTRDAHIQTIDLALRTIAKRRSALDATWVQAPSSVS